MPFMAKSEVFREEYKVTFIFCSPEIVSVLHVIVLYPQYKIVKSPKWELSSLFSLLEENE